MGKMSLSKGFTDDWEIHLQADELEELEAVHVGLGHGDVADHQVELVPVFFPLPEHVQRRLGVRHHCRCVAPPENPTVKTKSPKNCITTESGK